MLALELPRLRIVETSLVGVGFGIAGVGFNLEVEIASVLKTEGFMRI